MTYIVAEIHVITVNLSVDCERVFAYRSTTETVCSATTTQWLWATEQQECEPWRTAASASVWRRQHRLRRLHH